MKIHTVRGDIVISWPERLLISLNLCAISMLQKVIFVKPHKYLYHRVEVGVRHSVREDETTKHNIRVSDIVDVYIATGGPIRSHQVVETDPSFEGV